MPVKRTLRLEDNDNQTPAKRPAPDRNYSPLTGTCQMSPSAAPQAGKAKARGKTANSHKPQVPQTEVEILHAISSKLEASVGAFIKARQELKKIVAAEGSSELKSFFSRGSADLKTELRRHRELASKAESCLGVNGAGQSHLQGRGEGERSAVPYLCCGGSVKSRPMMVIVLWRLTEAWFCFPV
ncbi:centromere protein R isoform X3 [Salmo salar]|uniref:Centromere protein R isoform X3 n=1 Tax=Salmo salar TaxID=8030 RepID=A0ABM3CB22_SALSA|nr:centromere protein R isoform X3 [Salmo salar]